MNRTTSRPGRANGSAYVRRVAYLLLVFLLTACESSDDEPPAPSEEVVQEGTAPLPSSDSGSPATESPATGSAWVTGVVEGGAAITGAALLTGVRVAKSEGFERMVLEFDGSELPAYRIEYVDRPVYQCGSGEPVEIEGDGWLRINLQPANAHTEEGVPTITERASRPALPIIRELRMICDFEAMVEWVVGVSSPNPYRVSELTEPTRLVVDIRQ